MNQRITHVSFATRLDLETRELGEDFPLIKEIDETYAKLEALLDKLRASGSSERAKKRSHLFYQTLSDARNDASWAGLSEVAKAAYAVADVRAVAKPVLTLVT